MLEYKAGTIPNDTRRYIKSITHIPELDRENPRVEVEVREMGGVRDDE